jgi:hypothetical protein
MTLLEILMGVRKDPPLNSELGICEHIANYDSEDIVQFKNIAQQWPEYSGSRTFPVPHPNKNSQEAYMSADSVEMWGTGPYAKARYRLLDWVIEYLKTNQTDYS